MQRQFRRTRGLGGFAASAWSTISAEVASFPRFGERAMVVAWWAFAIACLWSIATFALGGFVLDLGPLHLASRNATRATFAAAMLAVVLALGGRGRAPAGPASPSWSLYVAAAVVASLVPTGIGLAYGTFVAGGADPYGYVSQADLWRTGELRIAQPLAAQLPWTNAQEVLSPLGYRPSPDGTSIVPTYAPGLPLLMAVARSVAGPQGPFLIGPLAAGLTVLLTFLLGRRWYSNGVALGAATWLALSPAFVHQTLWPMSDIPATALTVASVFFAARGGLTWWLARAWCLMALVLVRPNLLLVAVAVAAWPTVGTAAQRRVGWMTAWCGLMAGVAGVALVQWHLYGAPWRSGYGAAETLYGLSALWPNLQRYPLWLVQQHTPVILLALVPFVWRGSRGGPPLGPTGTVIAAVWISYLFYGPFEEWWYLRFILPSLPFLLLLAAGTLARLLNLVRLPSHAVALTAWTMWSVVAGFEARQIDHLRLLGLHREEARYAALGAFVDRRLPANAVVLTSQHSGSIRYYGRRLTARWDALPEGSLDESLDTFESRGLRPFFVLDDWEEAPLLRRLAPDARGAAILGAVIGEWRDPGLARVYDPRLPRSVAAPERVSGP